MITVSIVILIYKYYYGHIILIITKLLLSLLLLLIQVLVKVQTKAIKTILQDKRIKMLLLVLQEHDRDKPFNITIYTRHSIRDSNPPVLARNLPFLGIIFVLPFLLLNFPLFCFPRKKVKFVVD